MVHCKVAAVGRAISVQLHILRLLWRRPTWLSKLVTASEWRRPRSKCVLLRTSTVWMSHHALCSQRPRLQQVKQLEKSKSGNLSKRQGNLWKGIRGARIAEGAGRGAGGAHMAEGPSGVLVVAAADCRVQTNACIAHRKIIDLLVEVVTWKSAIRIEIDI